MRAVPPIALALTIMTACGANERQRVPIDTAPIVSVAPPVSFEPSTSSSEATTGSTSVSTSSTTAPSTTSPSTTVPVPTSTTIGDPRTATVALTVVAEVPEPIAVTARPGDSATWFAQRSGLVRRIANGALSGPVLDMSDRTVATGERGLLGMAFSPDGAFLYVDYTDRAGTTNVDEYAVAPDGTIDAGTRRSVLTQEQPFANHNGGHLTFGPDGYLYIGFGDGGSGGDPGNRAQDLGTWLGKILRISPRVNGSASYSIPADNPFVGQAGARPEIWSYGLRNPWRFSFDRGTGDLWIGDVGQNAIEEIDHRSVADGAGRGANFGWRRFEGDALYNESTDAPGAIAPVFTYRHGPGACSITGGEIYRGAITALNGAYLFGDACGRTVLAWTAAAGLIDLGVIPGQLVSLGYGGDGNLYLCDLNGRVLRLDAR